MMTDTMSVLGDDEIDVLPSKDDAQIPDLAVAIGERKPRELVEAEK